jgi:hypothetical protein
MTFFEKSRFVRLFPLVLVVLIGFLFILTQWQNVFAAKTNTIPRYGWCCGGTHAMATVRAQPYNSNQRSCLISSGTEPATVVNVIGWTWWQCDSIDNFGNVINSTQGSPIGPPPASFRNATTEVNICRQGLCGDYVKSHGMHDFNHTGASEWRPYNMVIWP